MCMDVYAFSRLSCVAVWLVCVCMCLVCLYASCVSLYVSCVHLYVLCLCICVYLGVQVPVWDLCGEPVCCRCGVGLVPACLPLRLESACTRLFFFVGHRRGGVRRIRQHEQGVLQQAEPVKNPALRFSPICCRH